MLAGYEVTEVREVLMAMKNYIAIFSGMEAKCGDTLLQSQHLGGRDMQISEVEASLGDLYRVLGQLGYILRPCLQRKENRKRPEILPRE